ncbi:hypothetical protein [Fimbriimonas ginsengisoli]|uniref:Putative lipoprotein n=1 Tax=Fimbriimonas ginsengisoli Gsoil 348 TaxID=661478 RepID=A0A068NSR4_FIMGI|nr:hypothetical protein [Fimbriimonas ginsengisoli]AIE86476.1 putative lipoprotein [Fimbriimonas ginsengisoli Gsoil 348]
MAAGLTLFGAGIGCGGSSSNSTASFGLPGGRATAAQVAQGRYLVVSSGCGDCHSQGGSDPSSPTWLSGYRGGNGPGIFQLGPTTTVYAANISPDNATGIGALSDQSIFNVLRYGWDPASPPNAGAAQHYVAPIMPWASFRHKTDAELWAIVAYLKHGAGAVSNAVPETVGAPPDFWAGASSEAAVGPLNVAPYPAGVESFHP